MTDLQKINSCPFCQAKAEMRETEDNANYIECTGCGASTNLQYSLKEDGRPDLIERWNNRTELGAAWNELMCCDDIRLDQGMAVAVGDLQNIREALERENAGLRAALRKIADKCTRVLPTAEETAIRKVAEQALGAPGEEKAE